MSQFTAEELRQMSSDSILDEYEQRRMRLQDYGRRKNISSFSHRQFTAIRSDPIDLDIYSNKLLELLLFCSTMILWMSGIVMLAFGFYLVFSQYGWAVMTGSTMYWLGMMLQTASALCILTAAGITTTLLSPDMETPRRALFGLALVIISAFILLSEIIVCSLSKANQQLKSENFYNSILNNSVRNTLSEQDMIMARREIIIIPILVLVYRTTVQKITRVQPTVELSNRSIAGYSQQSIREYSNQSVHSILDRNQ